MKKTQPLNGNERIMVTADVPDPTPPPNGVEEIAVNVDVWEFVITRNPHCPDYLTTYIRKTVPNGHSLMLTALDCNNVAKALQAAPGLFGSRGC